MAIMAILMAMIVGVVPQIQDMWRARLTRTRLLAVVASLQAYADDYGGKYPYPVDADDIMVKAAKNESEELAIFGIKLSDVPSEYREEVVLYGALTSARRRGPYHKGAGGQTIVRKGSGDREFNLLADGWERPILYEYVSATGLLVRSVGRNGVRETGSGGDDIVYYVFEK